MLNVSKKFRNYKANFKFNSKYENVSIPDTDVLTLINLSKSSIHVYTYLAANANKQVDLGYIRNIKTKDICKAMDMPVETVLYAFKQLSEACLTYHKSIGNGIYDICILNYRYMFKEGYTQYPCKDVFSDSFLKFDKATVAGYLYLYYVNFKNIIPQLRRMEQADTSEDKGYHKYVDDVKVSRTLKLSTLLKYIRRNNDCDAKKVLDNLSSADLINITRFDGYSSKYEDSFMVAIDREKLKDIFRPAQDKEYIKSFRMAFKAVSKTIYDMGNQVYFDTIKHLEDLTQMTMQYGQGLIYVAMDKLRSLAVDGKLLDAEGNEIFNTCAYIRTIVDNIIEDISKNDDTRTRRSIIDRFKNVLE